eukprot:m.49521 g.49521  ORF g.49521 m.49521 type:complete len:87 (+) comp10869_c0_seq1:1108-1368(+)
MCICMCMHCVCVISRGMIALSFLLKLSLSVSDSAPDGTPPVLASFRLPNTAISGLKLKEMQIFNVNYKSFKGAKYITTAGDYQVRT